MNEGHFKLGLFVTIAVAILVCFLLTLGVMDRFRPSIEVETYFEESIHGLQSGADVMFRGVDVGSVSEIGFAAASYEEAAAGPDRDEIGGLIRVEIALDTEKLARFGERITPEFLEGSVDRGLRTSLAMSGIGGPTFVEIDFVDKNVFPKPDLPWTPRYVVIPSVPSTVGTIVTSLASILRQIDQGAVVEHLVALSAKLDAFFDDFEQSDLYGASTGALGELRAASAEARALLADPRIDSILDDAGATLDGARTLLDADNGKLEPLIADLAEMSGSLDRAARSLDTLATNVNESDLVDDLRTLADDMGPAGHDLAQLATRLDRLVRGNETQIADTIRGLRNAVGELQALLEELKANPSRILAAPPPKGTPGGRP